MRARAWPSRIASSSAPDSLCLHRQRCPPSQPRVRSAASCATTSMVEPQGDSLRPAHGACERSLAAFARLGTPAAARAGCAHRRQTGNARRRAGRCGAGAAAAAAAPDRRSGHRCGRHACNAGAGAPARRSRRSRRERREVSQPARAAGVRLDHDDPGRGEEPRRPAGADRRRLARALSALRRARARAGFGSVRRTRAAPRDTARRGERRGQRSAAADDGAPGPGRADGAPACAAHHALRAGQRPAGGSRPTRRRGTASARAMPGVAAGGTLRRSGMGGGRPGVCARRARHCRRCRACCGR